MENTMPDVQDAASSAVPVVETPTFVATPRSGPEYDTWRKTGALPEKKTEPVKPADTATADTSKETHSGADEAEIAPDTDRATTQEPSSVPYSRLQKEVAKRRDLERELEEYRRAKQTAAPESSTAKPARPSEPQSFAEWEAGFKPSRWVEEYAKANPEASYEEANYAMGRYVAKVEKHFDSIEQRVNTERQVLESKVSEARTRYENFDEIKSSFLSKVVSDQGTPLIPLQVLGIMNDSDILPDLLYTIGSDEAEMQKFVEMAKTSPNKAIRYIARVEELIQQTLSKSNARNERGQFAKTEPAPAPAKRGPESAPEPPIEIGSRGSGPMDESERALKDAERGSSKAFRLWKEAEDRKELARRRGA
jgi:hypothetical protein